MPIAGGNSTDSLVVPCRKIVASVPTSARHDRHSVQLMIVSCTSLLPIVPRWLHNVRESC